MRIDLTEKQYKSLPYKKTSVSRAKTYGDIIDLLEGHNIKDWQFLKFQDEEFLSFPIRVKRRDVEQGFLVKVSVPKLYYPLSHGRSRYAKKTVTYLEKESWRMFWWYVKSKLNAIEYGISDVLKEFMYDITYSLTDNEGVSHPVSLGETVLENLSQLPKLSAVKRPVLEYKEILGEQ